MREREREKERACERERKRASKNEIEIECEREKATSSNACVTPPTSSPVPHAHVCNPNPGAYNLCREHVCGVYQPPAASALLAIIDVSDAQEIQKERERGRVS